MNTGLSDSIMSPMEDVKPWVSPLFKLTVDIPSARVTVVASSKATIFELVAPPTFIVLKVTGSKKGLFT